MITTYADAEEAEVRFNKDAGTHRPPCRYDDSPDDRHQNNRHYDDHNYHHDSGRDQTEGPKPGQNRRRWLDHIVAAISQPRAKRNYDKQYQKILDGPCPLHKNAKHKMKNCLGLAKEFQDKKLEHDANDGVENADHPGATTMPSRTIFITPHIGWSTRHLIRQPS
jgi:hypothetical protein